MICQSSDTSSCYVTHNFLDKILWPVLPCSRKFRIETLQLSAVYYMNEKGLHDKMIYNRCTCGNFRLLFHKRNECLVMRQKTIETNRSGNEEGKYKFLCQFLFFLIINISILSFKIVKRHKG